MIQTRNITVEIYDVGGEPLVGASVSIKLEGMGNGPYGAVAPAKIYLETGADGRVVVPLWENDGTYSDTHYVVSSYHPSSGRKIHDSIPFTVRNSDAFLQDLIELSPVTPVNPTQANLDKMTADRAAVSADRSAVSGQLSAVQTLASQVGGDAQQVSSDKQSVESSKQSVDLSVQTVTEKAQAVEGLAQGVSENKDAVIDAKDSVAEDRNAIQLLRNEVEGSKSTVVSNRQAVDQAAAQTAENAQSSASDRSLASQYRQSAESSKDSALQAKAAIDEIKNAVEQLEEAAANHKESANAADENALLSAATALIAQINTQNYYLKLENEVLQAIEAREKSELAQAKATDAQAESENLLSQNIVIQEAVTEDLSEAAQFSQECAGYQQNSKNYRDQSLSASQQVNADKIVVVNALQETLDAKSTAIEEIGQIKSDCLDVKSQVDGLASSALASAQLADASATTITDNYISHMASMAGVFIDSQNRFIAAHGFA